MLTLRFHNGGGVFDVNEQRVREYTPGIQWHFGQQVAAPMPGQPQNLLWGATVEAGGIKRCRGRYDAAVDALERRGGCFVLLLTRDGSHGLDLSMTSHLYLLEKIWDPAIEAQVVARACRLGATGSAVVEQLVMKGTVEEMLLDIHAQQHGEAAAAAAACRRLGRRRGAERRRARRSAKADGLARSCGSRYGVGGRSRGGEGGGGRSRRARRLGAAARGGAASGIAAVVS